MEFRKQIIHAFRTYQLPIIELKKETSRAAVCLVLKRSIRAASSFLFSI